MRGTDRSNRRRRRALISGLALLAGGCLSPAPETTPRLAARLDRVAADETALPRAVALDARRPEAPSPLAGMPITLDLDGALRAAFAHNRAHQARRDRLYTGGLAELAARRQWEPQLAGTLAYVATRTEAADATTVRRATLDLESTQRLPGGGRLRAGMTAAADAGGTVDSTDDAQTYSLRLTQPLLAGAGFEADREDIRAAERALEDAVRAFALDRVDFALDVRAEFLDLLIGRDVLENTRANLAQAAYLRRRSEALFRIRRAPAVDVMRSQQQELVASNAVSEAETGYDLARQRFLITLGLDTRQPFSVTGAVPPVAAAPFDTDQAVALALARRPDVRTARDRVADAARAWRLARNALRPDLDAYVEATRRSEDDAAEEDEAARWAGGLTLSLPLDRRDARDDVRRAALALAAARREQEAKTDAVQLEVIETLRRLRSLAATAAIAASNMELAARRADFAVIEFRNGNRSNRDVVEAQDELLKARNAHVRTLAEYANQRLRLLRHLGLVDVDETGRLVELTAPGEPEP